MQNQTTILAQFADVTLPEHRSVEVALSDAEVALLRREFVRQVDITPTSTASIYTLRSHRHVGFVILPSGRVIEIRTKVRVDVLFAMLAKAHHLADFRPDSQAYTSVANLFEFVVGFFVGMVEDIVARGILRSFEQVEDELLALRGKVLIAETLRHRPVVRDRHWCDFTEFTADVLENRILTLACNWLMPYPYRRIPDLSNRLRRLLRTFAEVNLDPVVIEGFDQLVYHRLNEHYRPALALARLLLSCLSPSGARGPHQFLAFLVNMDTLFEKYISVVLQEAAVSQNNIQVIPQDVHKLDLDGQITVKPDVVIYRGDTPCLAVDAKYKRDDPNADVYQALAYCHALDVPKTILIYPASEGIATKRHHIQPDDSLEVVTLPLNLSGGLDDLQRHTQGFVKAVWREISM